MKILKVRVTRRTKFKFAFLLSIRLVVVSLCVLPLALEAQTEKQITYPVAVPVVRAAATSVPSAPALTAPVPIIRPVEEAATPPVRAKAPVKKSTTTATQPATKTTTKAAKKATASKSATKTTAAKATKKPAANAKPKTQPKNPQPVAAKKPVPKKPVATKPVSSATKSPAQVSNKNSASRVVVPLVAGAAVAAAAAGVSAEEEQELARSLAEEGDYLNEPNISAAKTSASAVEATEQASAAVKTVLPVSHQREAFVTEFKNYVETKVVPKTPGLALAIIADGKVKVLETYGVKKAGGSRVNTDTAFRLASVSKSFAATVAAMMVNDGLIRWDTKITDVLPNVEFSNPRYGDQMTVQHILSQSTGLPTHAGDNSLEEGLSFDEIIRRLRFMNFVCPPGKCYNYQNVTYSLISNIVLKKTGMTYEQYLESKVLRPLGMRTATVGYLDYTANNNYAVPHIPTSKGWVPTTVTEHYYRVNPAAGVNASITDMSRWLLAQMGQNPAILSPALLNTVHAKITRNPNHYRSREGVTNSHYGLGWRVFDYRGDKNFVHHGGGVKGFRSEMVFNPELKIGMVILTNGPRLSGSVIFDFLDAYEDEKRGKRKKEAAPVKKKK
jgi:beta-lactamase class C